MLLELNITNIALIESLRIEFARGFNVLTGETGSGKSIVVDCMNLVLGGRADRELVRTGTEKGSVQALFDISCNERACDYAKELGLDVEDGLLAVSRELSKNGRNICRLAGVIVPLTTLSRMTGTLLDIHGQHEHQALLNPARHIEFLDSFGDAAHHELVLKVEELHQKRSQIAVKLKKLLTDSAERERLVDMLTFQVNEIREAHLRKGEEEKLTADLRILENAERIRSGIENAYVLTYRGNGRSFSAQEMLLRASRELEAIAGMKAEYAELAVRLKEVYELTKDIGYELQDMVEHLDINPEQMDKINERLELIDRLERKYGATLEEVITFGQQAAARLAEVQSGDEQLEELKKQLKEADKQLKTSCEMLTESRSRLASNLAEAVMRQLKDLGMSKTRFEVKMELFSKPTANGLDNVEFMISPNPGEPLRPLAAIASGGELSRIMLAMKAISMDMDGVDSMVFDEIDTGVSGRMAQVVGEKMCMIARNRQVLCVTHLPQIAALGNAHFIVEKRSDEVRTQTFVIRLEEQGRVSELSRLVGGAEDSESSLSHARHMLADAAIRRQQVQVG